MHRLLLFIVAILLGACGDSESSQTGPTPTPSPSRSMVALAGTVTTQHGTGIADATVTILDGVNAGHVTTTNSSGEFRFEGLTQGNGNVRASAAGYGDQARGAFINGTNTLAFTLPSAAPWHRTGTGNDVFDKPAYVAQVRITAQYSGQISSFIIWCGSQPVVDELLGTSVGRTSYAGTHATPNCTEVRVETSSGVAWSLGLGRAPAPEETRADISARPTGPLKRAKNRTQPGRTYHWRGVTQS